MGTGLGRGLPRRGAASSECPCRRGRRNEDLESLRHQPGRPTSWRGRAVTQPTVMHTGPEQKDQPQAGLRDPSGSSPTSPSLGSSTQHVLHPHGSARRPIRAGPFQRALPPPALPFLLPPFRPSQPGSHASPLSLCRRHCPYALVPLPRGLP